LRAERNDAERAKNQAQSRELAAASENARSGDTTMGALLAVEANDRAQTVEAKKALAQAVADNHERHVLPHGDTASEAVYSPGGNRIAVLGFDSQITVWDAASGHEIARLAPHRDATGDRIVFQPGGKKLLVVTFNAAAELWDVDHSRRLTRVPNVVTASLDARFLIAVDRTGPVTRWSVSDADTGRRVTILPLHGFTYDGWSFSGDGRTVIVSVGSQVTAIDWRRRDITAQLHLPGGAVHVSPDGRYAVSGAGAVWDLRAGKRVFQGRRQPEIVFSADSRFAIVAHDRRPTQVVSLPSGQAVETSYRPVEPATNIDQRGRFRVQPREATPTIFDALTGRPAVRYRGSPDARLAGFSPDGEHVLLRDGPVVRIEAVPPTTAAQLLPPLVEAGISAVAGEPRAVTGLNWDDRQRLSMSWVELDRDGVRVRKHSRTGPALRLRALGLSRDGRRVLLVDKDGLRMRVVPSFAPQPKVPLVGPEPVTGELGEFQYPSPALLSDDGRRLVTAVDNGGGADDTKTRVATWDLSRGEPLAVSGKNAGRPVALSPDGHVMVAGASASDEIEARVIDADTGTSSAVLRPRLAEVFDATFRAPGDRFVTVSAIDGVTRLWSRSGSLLRTLEGPGARSAGPVAFSPHGHYLASLDTDDNLQIWQSADGTHVVTLASSLGAGVNIAWLGTRVAVLDDNGMVTLIPCEVCQSTDRVRELALSRAARKLTRAELARYLPTG
jgi:WD40 repeat protein